MKKTPLVSIIVPTLNEEKYIAQCLDSILEANYTNGRMEVFVVDGMSQDRTREIVQAYHEKYSSIHLLENQDSYTPVGMNLGINASKGEYIFILSAHAQYEPDYFMRLVENIEKLNADCVGGVLVTDVKNKNKKSSAIKEVLMHKFGVGNASFRTGSKNIKSVDTVAFGCYRRSTFKKYGLFDAKLIRNQDIELNKRIINGRGTIYLIPKVSCTYFARENFIALAKNNYANGFWNILTAYHTKTLNSLSLRHFIPLLFVLSLIVPLIGSFIVPRIVWIALFSLVSYLSLVIIISFRLKNNFNTVGYLIVSFLTLHLSYGWGSLMGVFSVCKKMLKGEK